jgi:DNA-binding SARP family transcriptional activator
MDTLRITLFGAIHIEQFSEGHACAKQACEGQNPGIASHKFTRIIQALLANLLLQRPRSQSRELLAELFWGDQAPARAHSCLNTALWRLRQVLEPEGVTRGTYLITTSNGEVAFNWASPYWLDVAVFEDEARRQLAKPVEALTAGDVTALSQAIELCKGDLLEGFYDDWVLREREYLRQLRLNALARLLAYHKRHGDLATSIAYGQQILAIEPVSEEFHRELMTLYLENGQRALAVRQYENCRALLAQELELAPMPETQALYAQIRTGSPPSPLAGAPDDRTSSLLANQQLRDAMHAVEEARRLLQRALHTLERLG